MRPSPSKKMLHCLYRRCNAPQMKFFRDRLIDLLENYGCFILFTRRNRAWTIYCYIHSEHGKRLHKGRRILYYTNEDEFSLVAIIFRQIHLVSSHEGERSLHVVKCFRDEDLVHLVEDVRYPVEGFDYAVEGFEYPIEGFDYLFGMPEFCFPERRSSILGLPVMREDHTPTRPSVGQVADLCSK